MWSRLVSSDRYQLTYDASIIPALYILSKHYEKSLEFLYPSPLNPNYNFQYNSLKTLNKAVTPQQHLDHLQNIYGGSGAFEIFQNCLEKQSIDKEKKLLIINRFVYTTRYYDLFDDFVWTIDHAMESLKTLLDWLHKLGISPSTTLTLRRNPDWLKSRLNMLGSQQKHDVVYILEDAPKLIECAQNREVPIFWMKDMIATMNKGTLEFADVTSPADKNEVKESWLSKEKYQPLVDDWKSDKATNFRVGRFIQYLGSDPIERTSLVRSIGRVPQFVLGNTPILKTMYEKDVTCVALDNSKRPSL
jgi:hypothetical protein